MPLQAPQWTDFLSCPVCFSDYDGNHHPPISLGCGHTVCKTCLLKLHRQLCPFDQILITRDINLLPPNTAILRLVGVADASFVGAITITDVDEKEYKAAMQCLEELAVYLEPGNSLQNAALSRSMQRKLVTLINCQLIEEEGRARTMRCARSLGERSVTEIILHHQNAQQLSANLWAAVRARGCQFLGPAMQEEVLKLILLALEDGSALSRKVLVLFVVQRLEPHFPQASKTSIGHVVQLLYRASCFRVSKRDGDSSLMELKEDFRTYESLRREHDAQIVQIAMEAGLRIAPDQWSSLLYGDISHKSHMQSIYDKLQTPQSFTQSIQELVVALQRTGDPHNLASLRPNLEFLADIDCSTEASAPTLKSLSQALKAVAIVIEGLSQFVHKNAVRKVSENHHLVHSSKYKTSMCRDVRQPGGCPRATNCTFAHSEEELDRYRNKNKKGAFPGKSTLLSSSVPDSSALAGHSVGADVTKSNVTASPLQSRMLQEPQLTQTNPIQSHTLPVTAKPSVITGPQLATVQQASGIRQPSLLTEGIPTNTVQDLNTAVMMQPLASRPAAYPAQAFYPRISPYRSAYAAALPASIPLYASESLHYPVRGYQVEEVAYPIAGQPLGIDPVQNAAIMKNKQINLVALKQRREELIHQLSQCQQQLSGQALLESGSVQQAAHKHDGSMPQQQHVLDASDTTVQQRMAHYPGIRAEAVVPELKYKTAYVSGAKGVVPAYKNSKDEFIPWSETAVVSRFGPISRSKTLTTLVNTAPVQCDALQGHRVTVASAQSLPRPSLASIGPVYIGEQTVPVAMARPDLTTVPQPSGYYQPQAAYFEPGNLPYQISTIYMKVPVVQGLPVQQNDFQLIKDARVLEVAEPLRSHEAEQQKVSNAEQAADQLAKELQAIEIGIQSAEQDIIQQERNYSLWQG